MLLVSQFWATTGIMVFLTIGVVISHVFVA